MVSRRVAAIALQASVLLVFGCTPSPDPQQQQARFCQALAVVNNGGVDTRSLPELAGHAKVLQTLLDVAPQANVEEMAQFHGVFQSWAQAASGKDLRLYTLCTYSIWAGSAVDCMLDNEMSVAEGYCTLVISDREQRPGNLAAEGATWLDWGPYLDGQLTFRHVFRENPLVVEIARGVLGAEVSEAMLPYVPLATHCNKTTFERGGWRACFTGNQQGVTA